MVAGCVQGSSVEGAATDELQSPSEGAGAPSDSTDATDATPKSQPATRREFERALRKQLGFTRSQAQAIARSGFGAIERDREPAADELDTLRMAINKLSASLKE
jgi:hypothetical protein